MGVTETRVRRMGLSTRITMLAFVSVTIAVALVSAIALAGVYRSVFGEEMGRLEELRVLVSGDLAARITDAESAVDSLASRMGTLPVDASAVSSVLDEQLASDDGAFDALIVLDRSGVVRAAVGSDGTQVPDRAPASLGRSLSNAPITALEPSVGGGPKRLWVVRAVGEATSAVTVLGRIRADFLTGALESVALTKGSVVVAVFDSSGDLVLAGPGAPLVDTRTVELAGAEGAGGSATAFSLDSAAWSGLWGAMVPGHGLGLRIVTLEADADSFALAGGALVPAMLAMLLVVAFAVVTTQLYSRRLLAPLTLFEQHAREVAAGGYVRLLQVQRDDEMGRVAEAFNEMGARLNSLQDMTQLLATASNLDDVLDAVLGAITRILGTGEAAVLLAEPSGLALTLVRGRGLATPSVTLLVPLDEPSPFASAFHEQRAISFSCDDAAGGDVVHRVFGTVPDRAGILVPLAIGSEAIGVVIVLAPGRRVFTDAQIETLRVFSANAAVAVRTSRLFAEERLSRTEAEALRNVAELTVRSGDLGRALEGAAAIAADLLGYRGWTVVFESRQQLGLGMPPDREADRRLVDAWRLVEGERDQADVPYTPLVVEDIRSHEGLFGLVGPGWGSVLFIPVMQGSVARGALVLHDLTRMHRPTERQISVAETIGQQVSLAIRNAYLLQQARTRAANLETVFRISQTVSSELELRSVLNRVLDVVQKILSADAVALMSYDPERHVIETSMARGVSTSEMLYFHAQPGEDIPGRVFALGVPVSYGDLSNRHTPLATIASQQGFESLLAVPLMARGRPIGVLVVYAKAISAFSGEDVELLLTFAAQAALAVDTAALYGKEHHVASILQSSILPERLPTVPGLEVASFYLPSGAEAEIGGDYYDVFAAEDGRTVLAIGDVCGKGVVAATKTSMIKYTLRGAIGAGAGPGQALAQLNRQIAAGSDPSDIVTMWVGMLDVRTGTLTYADGGHPPALLLRADTHAIDRLGATGPLLGAVSQVSFEERVIEVGVGDIVLLYTDGITEARRSVRFFGEGRVRSVLRHSHTAHECLELLLAAVKTYSVGPLKDDAAALAVRRIETPSPSSSVREGEVG